MLKWKDGDGVDCEVSLDEAGGHVMLTLREGEHRFSQALSAPDMGRILLVLEAKTPWQRCCEGDLVVSTNCESSRLELMWHDEHDSTACRISLGEPEKAVFEMACIGHCRQLMRANKGV